VVFFNAPSRDYFDLSGVEDCVAAAAPVYGLPRAKGKLPAAHPDCGHDFPPHVREQAYRVVDRELAHHFSFNFSKPASSLSPIGPRRLGPFVDSVAVDGRDGRARTCIQRVRSTRLYPIEPPRLRA
jgi:hypothetical protein